MTFVSASLSLDFSFEQESTSPFGNPSYAPEFRKTLKFGAGITAGNADLAWAAYREIAASANDDLDLAGVLTDVFGATITAAELVGILVFADATNVNDVLIGGGTNPFAAMWGAAGDIIKVKPGGVFCNFARDAVGLGAIGAGTTDILRVANGGAGTVVNYSIGILARTA